MSATMNPTRALAPAASPEPPLRSYQREMLQYASKNNVLVVLNTGTGKTRIALELIRQHSQQLIAKSQLAVFLTPSVPLGAQQAEVLRAAGIPTEAAFGDLAEQRWGPAEWSHILNNNLALVMTPDVFASYLSHALIKMDNIGLLVFDEVHHCSKNHAFAVVQQAFYHAQPPGAKPRVLGLTASPGSGLQVLQADTDSLIITPKNLSEVEQAVPRPKPEWVAAVGGTLAASSPDIAEALKQVQGAYAVMTAVCNYTAIKENMATRARFEQDVVGDGAGDFSEVQHTSAVASLKDLEHMKKQVGGVQDALQQLGPWPAAVVMCMDLLSSICKLPADFEDLKPYMLADMMDRGDLGPDLTQAQHDLWEAEQQLVSLLNGTSFASCQTLLRACIDAQASTGGEAPYTVALEEVALRHTLLATLQAVTQLLAASPEQAQRIVSGAEAAMAADSDTSVLELRNEGDLEEWGTQVMQLVPAEALQQQVLGDACTSNAGRDWLQANGISLVDPKVQTMVKLVKKAREASDGAQPDGLQEQEYGPYINWAALVFATRKTTCLALDQLFKAIPLLGAPAFATSMFVGNTDLATGSAPMSMTQVKQEAIRVGFGSGHLNVLFATTVGSEGLDFRQCQLVLAFDAPPNVVQLVQSGGRARARRSQYIILHDPAQSKAVAKLLKSELQMLHTTSELARSNMSSIEQGRPNDPTQVMLAMVPPSKALAVAQRAPGDTRFMSEERLAGAYRVPSTGALCLPPYAQQLLQNYVFSLPGNDRWSVLQPYYAYRTSVNGSVSCTLYLPNNAACVVIRPDGSQYATKKDEAKMLTCLAAIKELHRLGALDDRLRPCRDHTHSRTLAKSLAQEDLQPLKHEMPRVMLSEGVPAALQLPPEQQQRQQPSAVACTAYLYSFEVVADQGAPSPAHASQAFGLLLPQALPVELLPAVEIQQGSASGPTASKQLVRLCSWGAVQLSAAQSACLEACQGVLQDLMLDVPRPAREPWQRALPTGERLSRWELVMGLPQLRLAMAALDQEGRAAQASSAGSRKQLWYWVPLQPGGGATCGSCINWVAMGALAAGPTPLARLQGWQQALSGDPTDLQAQVEAHGLVIAMHSGKLHVAESLRHDLHPSSPFDDVTKAPTYTDYYLSRWGVTEALDEQQPMLRASQSSGRGSTNVLPRRAQKKDQAAGNTSAAASTVHLVPQLVALHPLNLDQWQCLHTLPSLMYRLEGMLTAHQLVSHLRCNTRYLSGVSEPQAVSLTLQALTCTSCSEAYDLELPELMGDAIIKHAVSVHGYLISDGDATAHEGALSCWRELFVSNEVLLKKAVDKLHLDRALRVSPFDLRRQVLRGRLDAGTAATATAEHEAEDMVQEEDPGQEEEPGQSEQQGGNDVLIRGKRLADSVEALIGIHCWPALQQHLLEHPTSPTSWSADLDQALAASCSFMAASGLLPADLKVMSGAGASPTPEQQTKRAKPNAKDRAALEQVQGVLQYRFRNSELPLQALTHCSFPSVTRGSYQRLEFLGDAVLGLLVTVYVLLSRRCEVSSGKATDLRSDLVSNEMLASVCLSWGLQTHLRIGSKPLLEHIHSWAKDAKTGDQDGAAEAGTSVEADVGAGAEDDEYEEQVAPKALADVVEALVGAVFVDSNGDLDTTMKVAMRLLRLDASIQAGGAAATPMPRSRRMVLAGQGTSNPARAHMSSGSIITSPLARNGRIGVAPARSTNLSAKKTVPKPVRQNPQLHQQVLGRGPSVRRNAAASSSARLGAAK